MQENKIAQELARSFYQFWRLSKPNGSYHGVNPGEFMLLIHLKHLTEDEDKGVKVSDLSEKLQVTSAAVTQKINILKKNGLVERYEDPNDRRVVLVKITPEGLKVLKKARREHLDLIEGLVNHLGQEDSKELVRILSLVLAYTQERRNNKND